MAKAANANGEVDLNVDEVVRGITEWAEIETPSNDANAVNRLVDVVEGEMRSLGFAIKRTPGRSGHGDILAGGPPADAGSPCILVLGHLDTVHPKGTLERVPIRKTGDRLHGPGVFDMKGGAYVALHAMRCLIRSKRNTMVPVRFLFCPDEEVFSPTSRPAIEQEARDAKYALVAEPAAPGGRVITGRKGLARYEMVAIGRPAHPGRDHQHGRSAIRELAKQVERIEQRTDYARGITANVGMIRGGEAVNIVPARCEASLELRFPDDATGQEACRAIEELGPIDPDVALEISGGVNRPAFVKTEGTEALLRHAQRVAKELGFELDDTTVGGASDGNFLAAKGVPTLDGLGVSGAGAHTEEEYLECSSLVPKTRLFMRLLETLP